MSHAKKITANQPLLDKLTRLMWEASDAIISVYRGDDFGEALKSDDSTGGFSGHSMRVGAAQDLLARGFDIAAIMRAGRWKSVDTVSRYLEQSRQNVWK